LLHPDSVNSELWQLFLTHFEVSTHPC